MKEHRITMLLSLTSVLCVAASVGAQVTTTAPGDVALVSQKNLVDHMIIGDSLEVEAAQLAATRTQNAAVRDFATMLATDHQAHLDNLRKLAGKADVGREASATDSSGVAITRDVTQLKAMAADSGFDKAFISAQVQNHEREIAALKSMRTAAKDEELGKDIDATIPVLEKHLARAKEIAAQLNTPPGTVTPPTDPSTPAAASTAAPASATGAKPPTTPQTAVPVTPNPNAAAAVTPKPAADSTTAKKSPADSAAAKKGPADSTKKPVVPKPPTSI